jgi:hypothetical protein
MRITSKTMFVRMWNEGVFGNRPNVWQNVSAAVNSGYVGKVSIRYNGHGVSGPFVSDLHVGDLQQAMGELVARGWTERDLYIHEDTPNDTLCINGEVREYGGEFCLLYSTVPKRMRDSLKEGRRAVRGTVAKNILRDLLMPEDLEHLYGLLDLYSEHAIEFTGYRVRVGVLQRRMIVWEVRYY